MSLGPGQRMLLQVLLILIKYPLFVATAAYLLSRYTDLAVPEWLACALGFGIIPIVIFVHVQFRFWLVNRAAARRGAVLAPRWIGKWIGNLDVLRDVLASFRKGYPGDFIWDRLVELGPTIRPNVLGDFSVFTCDPAAIKAVLATEFQNYEKGEFFQNQMNSVLGTGVFNSDGDMWKWHRSMTRPFFSKDRISHFELFDRHAEEALNRMSERMRAGYAIDFQDLVSRFTLDSATEFLFNSCVHSLHSTLPYPHNTSVSSPFISSLATATAPVDKAEAFATAFSRAEHLVAERAALGKIWPLWEMREDKTREHMPIVDGYLRPILEDALRKKAGKQTGTQEKGQGTAEEVDEIDDGESLLDHLVKFTSDLSVLRDEVLNILMAGRDTTATTLTFAVYLLAMHPTVLKRLRVEVLEKVGPNKRPTYADIKEMRYLRAVINETLRLYPAVPFNIRLSVNEGVLPNSHGKPFYVPPKTTVSYSVWAMHRMEEYWGPDAQEYDPDRFLDERVNKYLAPNPFIFLPFNAGPRICLGQQFAYNEMSFFMIKLLQRFSVMELVLEAASPSDIPPAEWANAPGRKSKEKFMPKSHLTLYVKGGMWVRMKEVEENELEGQL